jgi:hypothetical protein
MSAADLAHALDARREGRVPEPLDWRNPPDAGDPLVVAVISKNRCDDLFVSLCRYNGHDLVDVRVHSLFKGVTEKRPTRKGVSLKVALLPELIAALNAAVSEARRLGLLRQDQAPLDSASAKDRTAAERQRRRRDRLRALRDVTHDGVTAASLFTKSPPPQASDPTEESARSEPCGYSDRRP